VTTLSLTSAKSNGKKALSQLAVAAKILIDQKPSYKDKLKIAFCGIGSFAPELKELFSSLEITECSAILRAFDVTLILRF
jgi:hypothetical protein